MRNNRGFTLLELLIAAAIIGVLAVMATQAFRVSSAEVRLRDAMTRARAVAVAARRAQAEYPTASFDTTPMQNLDEKTAVCTFDGSIRLGNLITCGFLDFRNYVDGDFIMQFTSSGEVCVTPHSLYKASVLGAKTYCTNGETEYTK